jgi:hypothetical protein
MSLAKDTQKAITIALGSTAAGTEVATNMSAQRLFSGTTAWIRTDAGTKVLAASVPLDREVIIVVTVTTAFATGDGAQPTFAFGQTGSTTKFAATSKLTTAAAGTILVYAGTLTGTKDLIMTAVAATGTTSTGAISVTVIGVGQ